MILPNLLCLGPPKCGTTSLYSVCETHPDICVSSFKEPAFFSRIENFQRGIEWYSNEYFSFYQGQKVIAEFTPGYFTSDIAINNIHTTLTNEIKFIVVIRNPAKRSLSHYLHWKRNGLIKEPFKSIIYKWAEIYRSHDAYDSKLIKVYTDSLYDIHFHKLIDKYNNNLNLLLINFEQDFQDDAKLLKDKLSNFLGIDKYLFKSDTVKANSSQTVSKYVMPIKKIINSENGIKKVVRKLIPIEKRHTLLARANSFINKAFYKEISKEISERELVKINQDLFKESIMTVEDMFNIKLRDSYLK